MLSFLILLVFLLVDPDKVCIGLSLTGLGIRPDLFFKLLFSIPPFLFLIPNPKSQLLYVYISLSFFRTLQLLLSHLGGRFVDFFENILFL